MSSEPIERSQSFAHQSVPQAYQTYFVPSLFAPWARLLLDFVGVRAGASVLDVASGTGVVAHLAAERVGATGQVTATDISPAMLAVAQASCSGDTVRYLVCPADALAVPDRSQDVVLCQNGIQFFPDKQAATREMRRALRPGGTVGILVWAAEHPLGLFEPMIEAVAPVIPEPFPRGYDPRSAAMTASEEAGMLGLPEAVVESIVKRQIQHDLLALKDVLEARAL
jgi:ubiquinone/menaquinone biosynthesis C-methylase UbiE